MSYNSECYICHKKSKEFPLPCGCTEARRDKTAALKKGCMVLDIFIIDKNHGPWQYEKLQSADGVVFYLQTNLQHGGQPWRIDDISEDEYMESYHEKFGGEYVRSPIEDDEDELVL